MINNVMLATVENSPLIIQALNSELRRKILALLSRESLNVNEIAQRLGIPQSTCTTNLKLLEQAKLIDVKQIPARKGVQKVCSVACGEVVIPLFPMEESVNDNSIETEMPIGLYTHYEAEPPCGLVSTDEVIGFYDDKGSFLNPLRAKAQLIWFKSGYLEYQFPVNVASNKKIVSLSVIAEVCSEFPGHNENWPSDITVWINDLEVGTWTSPGDNGGKRGYFTPDWWRTSDTQFGFRKSWKVIDEGSFIDSMKVGDTSISDLDIFSRDSISVKIGVKKDSENQGGLNLFGRKFGNYENDIILKLDFE